MVSCIVLVDTQTDFINAIGQFVNLRRKEIIRNDTNR